jgi:prephenate dehydrogenase
VLVVGAGLIGTSVALALRTRGKDVLLYDARPDVAEQAAERGAGVAADGIAAAADAGPGVVVVAVPPAVAVPVVLEALRLVPQATVMHTTSAQAHVQAEVEAFAPEHVARFVGVHPIAGRERGGPAAAAASLLAGRPWAICAASGTGPAAVAHALALAHECGGVAVEVTADAHDRALATLSHAPQLVASALAGTLTGLPDADVALAGGGFRDTTRLADSDPELWRQIVALNRGPVADALRAVAQPLLDLATGLDADPDAAAVRDLVARGRAERARLPGKHGGARAARARVLVDLPDRPRALADLLTAVADAGVNLEDVRVDHVPGAASGIAELLVAADAAPALAATLRRAGHAARAGGDESL